ncbi:BRO-J [Lymantria xylina nucleopolyhedrovirus]|uniref:BRO-J n=1 Tax=Lymantria xylina multiple nucleopolyhedrovirus TaxID=2847840 RepID=D4N2H9_9ABAC|nr:BRO-J [Lymantria xylina nucleopolyhedrovirus]ADD73851.1 BRO-J [Lymantria xylina nucleopolyhedrovirus]
MSQVKIGQFKFGQDTFTLRYVLGDEQPVKFVAKDVASSLKYGNCNDAVSKHVDKKYKYTYSEHGSQIASLASNALAKQGDPLYLHPHTVLVTKEGVIQLIMKSKLPYAVELQAWLLEEVIPQVLCTGKYAPAVKINTNTVETLSTALVQANANLVEFTRGLIAANQQINVLADRNNVLTQALIASNERTAQLADRMADIAQDVITKPSNPRLRHLLAVCEIGQNEYAFLRPQKRNLKRSLDRLSVDNREIVYKSEYVPNAMNVLNKVKESLPKDKFKARHNKITLLEDLTKEDLVDAIDRSMTQRQVAIIAKNANVKNKIDYMNL